MFAQSVGERDKEPKCEILNAHAFLMKFFNTLSFSINIPTDLFTIAGGDSSLSRLEDQRTNRSASLGDNSLSDHRSHSARFTHSSTMEARLFQAK